MSARWDIFCRVIDNYGDAGVSWRLARILVAEHGLDVTLWLDRLEALAPIEPALDATRDAQRARGVTIRRWTDEATPSSPADVVIDAFGVGLPAAYIDAMVGRSAATQWFVLEYLTAESWADGTHRLASPHPRLPLARRFWIPGFTPKTGGLLREHDLFARRDAWLTTEARRDAFWRSLDLPIPVANECRVSLFCYPDAPVGALLDAWSASATPIVAIVPVGVATAAIERWHGGGFAVGSRLARGNATLCIMPFVAQDLFDRLLASCDVNFVRGEDSLARAQWLARPFVWQAYVQDEEAHQRKVDALCARYVESLDAAAANAVRGLWSAWNRAAGAIAIDHAWTDFFAARPALDAHAGRWAAHLASLPELAAGLVKATKSSV
jgi:uncharacterized repeat protein (TIGR03837 family)